MTWLALVRHGVTEWNERGVIQGRTDIPLSAAGEAALRRARPCDDFVRARWVSSPLRRARQSAAILNPRARAEVHDALAEADWGDFEGVRRDRLPARIRELGLTPARGLDFTPPRGESARTVQQRLRPWLATIAQSRAPVVAVTHKGVIRNALSIACEWDMQHDFRPRADWTRPHLFRFDDDGRLRLMRLNARWDESPDADVTDADADANAEVDSDTDSNPN
ncbi:MAG: histidine phosphatase family protein [bacterium]